MRRLLLILLLLPPGVTVRAQAPDSLRERLDSTVFAVERPTSLLHIGVTGPTTVLPDQLRRVPTLMGTADPIRFVRLLPGVQTGMELDAGLHIQGTENAHCLISADGVPLYGATHLLGLFPTFIATHYRNMEFTAYAPAANRLGGAVNMCLADRVPRRFRGSFTSGLFETEGTLDIPLGSRSGLFISARKSYLNLLYGYFLRFGDYRFRYGFGDGNLTWYWQPTPRDKVWVDAFFSADHVTFTGGTVGNDILLDWKNGMAAVHYKHNWEGGWLKQTLYYTSLGIGTGFQHPFYGFDIASSLSTAGWQAQLEAGRWRVRAEAAWHRTRSMDVSITNEALDYGVSLPLRNALELTLEARYVWPVTESLQVEAALKGIEYYSDDGIHYPALLPEAKVRWEMGIAGRLEAVAGMNRQNLFQTGLSSMGLPTYYWFLSDKEFQPAGSRFAALTWGRSFSQERYSVSLSAYYRDLSNLWDYGGSILNFLYPNYQLSRLVKQGSGRNYGVGVILHKQTGPFTGWIAYTLSRSLRTFDGITFPSDHERIHECNIVAQYTRGAWELGAVLIAASGLPYTPAESVLLLGAVPITYFTQRNAGQLPPYVRLDLSLTCFFHREPSRENGISVSLYNATGHKNILYKQLVTNEENQYAYRPQELYLRFLPSLSYFHKF